VIGRDRLGTRYPIKKLGEVVEFLDNLRRPVTESDRKPGPYPYYGANGIQGTIDSFIFDEPLVLLAEDGGHFENPARGIAYRIAGKTWVNNHAHVLRPRPGVDLGFVCRVLENYDVTPFVTGTTRGKLTKAGAGEIPLPIPPLPEQRRIAAILDQADAVRAKRWEALAQLDSLMQSIFIEMFGDPRRAGSTGSEPTKPRLLGELTRIRTGKLDANAADEDGAYPFFTCAVKALRINTAAFDCKATLVAGNGDLNVKYYEGKFNAYQRTYVIESLNESQLVPRFLYAFLDLYVAELRKQAIGGVIKYIKLPYLTDAVMQVPDVKTQIDFAARLVQVGHMRSIQARSTTEVDTLFASLQYRAFTGQLA
jgi:type I restriction enzyme, S subunit